MLQHVVLFRFPVELSESEVDEMRSQLAAFVTEIEPVQTVRFGPTLMPDWARGYQVLLYMELTDWDGLQTYLSHPAHGVFGKWTVDRGCEPVAFDYFIEQATLRPS